MDRERGHSNFKPDEPFLHLIGTTATSSGSTAYLRLSLPYQRSITGREYRLVPGAVLPPLVPELVPLDEKCPLDLQLYRTVSGPEVPLSV